MLLQLILVKATSYYHNVFTTHCNYMYFPMVVVKAKVGGQTVPNGVGQT